MRKPLAGNKKGIFFTSIAILISAVLVLTFGTPASVTTKEQLPLTQAKADLANAQARDLKYNYLPQSLYISTYGALYAMSEYMKAKHSYFLEPYAGANFNTTLKEMVVNGTMCCSLPSSPVLCTESVADINDPSKHIGVDTCLAGLMDANKLAVIKQNNFTKRLRDMENASFSAFRINTTFKKDYNDMAFWLFQDNSTGPWQIGANISVRYSITAGDVTINSTEIISTTFGIEGIPDPLYAVQSLQVSQDGNTLYTNYFNATNLTNWNLSTFYHEIEWRLYKQEPLGSSFLGRLYGKDEASECCGIESLINPAAMGAVSGDLEKPYVDWCYYGSNDRCTAALTGALWNVTCVTTEIAGAKFFKYAIDTYHATQYNITSNLTSTTPGPCPVTPFP